MRHLAILLLALLSLPAAAHSSARCAAKCSPPNTARSSGLSAHSSTD